MDFCLHCATRLKVGMSEHQDLSAVDVDAVKQRRVNREYRGRQRCFVALTRGYLEVGLSVDPQNSPGSRVLFVLNGPGPRRQRDIQRKLAPYHVPDMGHNYFELAPEVVQWIEEQYGKEDVSDVRETNHGNEVSAS